MKIEFLGSDSYSGGSPSLYATDRNTYLVQGWRVSDPEAMAAVDVPEHEAIVEIPRALLRFAVSRE